MTPGHYVSILRVPTGSLYYYDGMFNKVHPFMYSKFSKYSVTGDKFPLLLKSEGTQRTSSTCGWLAMAIYLKSRDVTN
jgi:hypothetical protein